MRAFGRLYQRSFEARPWATLAVTNGVLSVVGDALAQNLERRTEEHQTAENAPGWDPHRSARFLAFGVGMAPILAEWNHFIEHRFPLRSLSGRVVFGALLRRVAVDQLVFAPFGLALFVGSMGFMEGRRTLASLREKFADVYFPAVFANWKIWPFLQLVNFCVVPLRFVARHVLD
ncbi:hypothetical protein MSPP1_004237 [Malassezia sp. CBS 17886]|nr:hypothetical protein MSPP1_004237 [Malassezia sp. CBS 17886]